jgi:hypothetical protein
MDSSTKLSDFQTPYLTPNEGGVGVGASYSLPAARILLGATLPVDNVNRQTNGINKSLSGSIEFGSPSAQSLTLIAGITQEDGMLLGSKGSAAFSIEDAKSNTSYTGIKVQKKFGDIFSLEGVATIASSSMNDSSNMIAMASNLKSSSAALIGNFRNLSKDDHLSIYVSQPNRINSGSMSFKTAGLASSDRTITQSLRNINLESSSRQIDFGLSYRKEINKDLDLSLKHMLTKNLNHTSSSNRLHSSYIGLGYKDIKLGVSSNPGGSLIESKFTFSSTF